MLDNQSTYVDSDFAASQSTKLMCIFCFFCFDFSFQYGHDEREPRDRLFINLESIQTPRGECDKYATRVALVALRYSKRKPLNVTIIFVLSIFTHVDCVSLVAYSKFYFI